MLPFVVLRHSLSLFATVTLVCAAELLHSDELIPYDEMHTTPRLGTSDNDMMLRNEHGKSCDNCTAVIRYQL
jgi:hypothetical protein